MKLDREFLEWLIFGGEGDRRYTQSSPVLPDVWIAYGTEPGARHQLLFTPHRDASAGVVARVLRNRLGLTGPGRPEEPEELGHFLVYTPTSVAVRLSLQELIRDVLPMTSWWQYRFFGEGSRHQQILGEVELVAAFESLEESLSSSQRRSRPAPAASERRADPRKAEPDGGSGKVAASQPLSADVIWMSWIVGWLAWAEQAGEGCQPPKAAPPRAPEEFREWLEAWRTRKKESERGPTPADLVHALGGLFGLDESADGLRLPKPPQEEESRIWQINRNREAHLAVRDSRLAIKADAAWGLFDVSCRKLAWAVIDSGIDARHPAFRSFDRDGAPYEEPFPDGKNRTRVEATFDFTRTRLLLNPALLARLEEPITKKEEASGFTELPAKLEKVIESLETEESHRDSLRGQLSDLRALLARHDAGWGGDGPSPLRVQLSDLKKRLQRGAKVDWGLLEPFLVVPHGDGYWAPASDHGTHVAGILGADWREEGKPESIVLQGICPDIRLYDLRVLPTGRPGPEDELNVIAALQFVRHLNSASTDIVIHGINLSLSIPHAVASFACGCTPVCEECERVVAGGVVVVAAAGNNGWQRYSTSKGLLDGYHTISITDPGNTEAVITVGATHRNKPHTYGVSYFSSRGPTGDGRIKPDLVAPGEKISAPILGGFEGEKDGTSMAAPHVSGAAAILMARHRELIGQAGRIKKILCDTATDLGRERYFQGHGMLDVLRAVQSV